MYQFKEGLSIIGPISAKIVNAMTAMVSNLVAGNFYTFTITAENSNRSTNIDCGPVHHDLGEYV